MYKFVVLYICVLEATLCLEMNGFNLQCGAKAKVA